MPRQDKQDKQVDTGGQGTLDTGSALRNTTAAVDEDDLVEGSPEMVNEDLHDVLQAGVAADIYTAAGADTLGGPEADAVPEPVGKTRRHTRVTEAGGIAVTGVSGDINGVGNPHPPASKRDVGKPGVSPEEPFNTGTVDGSGEGSMASDIRA
ncbi:MAG TPA: hypothetical protein VFB38_06440 [Chthonomonadaceae bacterium]|nr:hypothetical protein [Chthonomonadaceae bacterium]